MRDDEIGGRDGRPDNAGAEGAGCGELGGDCCGDGADWLSDLEAKQREEDDHCCFEASCFRRLDKRLEREIGDDPDWLADLEAKQRDYDAHCDWLHDRDIERSIREGSIE
jgi:hypothetical protein